MLYYMKKHRRVAILALLLCVAAQVVVPLSVILEQKMLDYIIQGDTQSFFNILCPVSIILFISVSTYYLKALAVNKLKAKYAENLRNDLYDSIMQMNLDRFHEKDTAEYISNILNDVNTVTQNYTSPIFSLVGSGFSAVISVFIMIAYSPVLTTIAIICSFASFWVPVIITKNLKKQLIKKSIQEAEISIQLKESLNGYDVISAFDVFSIVRKKFACANSNLADENYKLAKMISLLENSGVVIGKVARSITFFIAGTMAAQGKISVGTLFLFVSLYEYFSSDVMLFSQCIPLLKSSKSVSDKLLETITETDCHLSERIFPTFSRDICVDNLNFHYIPEIPVLRGISFTIHKGEKVALVGPSGCGKSTLVKLISGKYEDYVGGIFFDKVEMKKLDIQQLKKIVSVIHQHTFIFNDTIRNNICLGEEFEESVLHRALDLSGVNLFLPSINGGLDGNCGEDGVNLSGGQKQRIALARALVRGIDFLILDEGTSAIDVETANMIETELLNMKGLTLLTITHRIKDGLIDNYDSIIVMDKGQIIERRYKR